ncbi:hypothetical protein BG004_005550 [Podila humilis]|nr:hypothetical protein BG004_005550 [Podila humilis]
MHSFRSFSGLSRSAPLATQLRTAQTPHRIGSISCFSSNTHSLSDHDGTDCPELPSTPSWSLASLLKVRDSIQGDIDQPGTEEITSETIDNLLRLAHLQKPTDPADLAVLQHDVIRIRNFLNYIRSNSVESQQCREDEEGQSGHSGQSTRRSTLEPRSPLTTSPELVTGLRSLVDDGHGLRTRSPTNMSAQPEELTNKDDLIRQREILLERPKRVKGNFFVVGTELDPKKDN